MQLPVSGLVLGPQRLLEPEIAVGRQRAADFHRLFQRVAPVRVDAEVDRIARAPAQALDPAAGLLHGAGHLHLDARETGFEIALELALHGGIVAPVDRGGVDRHLAPSHPAEQAMDRQPRDLAQNVPERDVDAGDGLEQHAARPPGKGSAHVLPERGDIRRVAADEAGLQRRFDQLGVGPG